ncbi:hypothetical protein [Candidatus Poriferisodalis sp.]|uniref:hypothetical protein n=1 Tax=Candidatus Poriferisodalis sp. TaxID=3101277 RepID=UPI003C6FA4EA
MSRNAVGVLDARDGVSSHIGLRVFVSALCRYMFCELRSCAYTLVKSFISQAARR